MKTISLHIIAALAASLALLPSPVASAQAGDRVAQQQLEVKRASAELNRIEAVLQGAKDNLARLYTRWEELETIRVASTTPVG